MIIEIWCQGRLMLFFQDKSIGARPDPHRPRPTPLLGVFLVCVKKVCFSYPFRRGRFYPLS